MCDYSVLQILIVILILQKFANEGLRTLVLGYKSLSEEEFAIWKEEHHKVGTNLLQAQDPDPNSMYLDPQHGAHSKHPEKKRPSDKASLGTFCPWDLMSWDILSVHRVMDPNTLND